MEANSDTIPSIVGRTSTYIEIRPTRRSGFHIDKEESDNGVEDGEAIDLRLYMSASTIKGHWSGGVQGGDDGLLGTSDGGLAWLEWSEWPPDDDGRGGGPWTAAGV
ncbi:hypothetical protein GQ457_06G044060 [Hibiscus cannabinus]